MRSLLSSALILLLAGVSVEARERSVRELVRETVIPCIQYRDRGADAVFNDLAEASREADPEGVGVNIVYHGPEGDDAQRITLSLRRISLYEAIRYITQIAGLHFRIDENAVFLSDQPFQPERITTRIYPVQPTFMDVIRAGKEEKEPPRRNPLFR